MGMYDSVIVDCPDCGGELEYQTKNGPCDLREYSINNCPMDIAQGVDGDTTRCGECGKKFTIHFPIPPMQRLRGHLTDA